MPVLRTLCLGIFTIIRWGIGLIFISGALFSFLLIIGTICGLAVLGSEEEDFEHYGAQGKVIEAHRTADGSRAVTVQFKTNDGKEYKSTTVTGQNMSPGDPIQIVYKHSNPQVIATVNPDTVMHCNPWVEGALFFGGFALFGIFSLLIGLSLLSKRIWRIWKVGPAITIPAWFKQRTPS